MSARVTFHRRPLCRLAPISDYPQAGCEQPYYTAASPREHVAGHTHEAGAAHPRLRAPCRIPVTNAQQLRPLYQQKR